MMKRLILQLKNKFSLFLILIILIIFDTNIPFSENVIDTSKFSVGPFALKYNLCDLTGDSYAAKFNDYEYGRDLKFKLFIAAGNTIDQNKDLMTSAFLDDAKIVIVSIGVNDQFNETPPYMFESLLRRFMNLSISQNKRVILHTYMKYNQYGTLNKKYEISLYDDCLRRVAYDYKNVDYIDLSDLYYAQYISSDNIHFNKKFYDILYSRIIEIIKNYPFNV